MQGHRGARAIVPESTLPSFEVALDLLVDTLEADLHLSRDDQLVVWHDPFIEARKCRLSAEGAAAGLPDPDTLEHHHPELMVRALTAAQLALYRCDRNPDLARFPRQSPVSTDLAGDDYSIITLRRLLGFVEDYAGSELKSGQQRENARRVRFNLETKRVSDRPELIDDDFDGESPALFERALVDAVEEAGLRERVIMQSFDHRSLWAARSMAPWLELAPLERARESDLHELRRRGASVWSPRASLVDATSVAEARAAGLRVIPWTVNDPAEMERLITLGVDGIITDAPDVLVGYR